ncbi:pitrilysin family protein [Streptomyces sp. CFMR 7]|uniref:M16 family metallopeptidase n=1 Tax=Streptomyces sp. CFMR 7 TaxID=1649184 RepID=UPI00119E987F|nr:pitrilysin family protein [Streptomyces sp. CFMR 7]
MTSTHRSGPGPGHATGPGPGGHPLPPIGAPPEYALPPLVDTVLSNGLRVVAVHAPSVPMVELRLQVPLPAAPGREAIAQVMAEALPWASLRYSAAEIQRLLGHAGASLTAAGGGNRLSLSASTPAASLPRVLEVLEASLGAPRYEEEHCRAAARTRAEQATAARSQPTAIAQEALRRIRHGRGVPPAVPSDADFAAVTAGQVARLHAESVRPAGAFLVAVGDIDPEHTVRVLDKALEGWGPASAGGGTAEPVTPYRTTAAYVAPVVPPAVELVERPGAVQSQILLAAPSLDRSDPRFPALSLGNCALGGYFSSRLVTRLREQRGLAYRVDSYLDELLDENVAYLDLDTSTATTGAACRELYAELCRLADDPPSVREIDAARQFFIGMQTMSLASQTALAGALAGLLGYGLDPQWLTAFSGRILEVGRAEVAAAVQEFFDPARFTGVVVGNRDGLAGQSFGPLIGSR